MDGREEKWARGRDAEFAVLTTSAATAHRGEARVVLVGGLAGTGKTTLLNWAEAQLSGQPGQVLHASGQRNASEYAAVRELFAPGESAAAESADRAAQALAFASGPVGSRPGAQLAARQGLYRVAADLLAAGPVTILLDDAQDCDLSTLRWIDFLLRRAAALPLLVVLGYRLEATGPASEFMAVFTRQSACVVIELQPLTESDTALAIARAFGEFPTPDFLRVCAELSGGNPARLRVLLDKLRARSVRPNTASTWRAGVIGSVELAYSTLAWLAAQPPPVRRVAAGIAVLNSAATRSLTTLLDLSAADVTEAVDELRQRGLLRAGVPSFAHEGVREAILGELPVEELAALRLRGARLLEDEGRPEREIASLLVQLPELNETWMPFVLRTAAADAMRVGQPKEMVRLLKRAQEAVPEHAETEAELSTVLAAADPGAALWLARQAIEQATGPRARAALAEQFAVLPRTIRSAPAAFEALIEALSRLDAKLGPHPVGIDRELRTRVETTLLLSGLDSAATAREALRRSRTMVLPEGNSPADRVAMGVRATTVMLDGGSSREAVRLARAAVASAARVPDEASLSAARVLHCAGQTIAALDVLGRVLDRGSAGDGWSRSQALAIRSTIRGDMGDVAEATADAERAMRLAGRETWAEPRIALASALLQQAEYDRAEGVLNEIREPRFIWEHHVVLLLRARLRMAADDLDGALEHLFHCGRGLAEADIGNPMLVPWWLDTVCVLARLDRRPEAMVVAEQGQAAADRWGTVESTGLGLTVAGWAAPGQAGADMLSEARRLLADTPAQLLRIPAEVGYGRALLQLGDVVGARRQLREGVDLAIRWGWPTMGAQAREMLVAAGGRVHRVRRRRLDLLTAAERRVVDLAAAGAANRKIGETLFVTLRTVETHLSSAYRKLDVTSRTELAPALRKAERPGLEAPGGPDQEPGGSGDLPDGHIPD
jgi:DNA-binding NarL/FixJ family response regulator